LFLPVRSVLAGCEGNLYCGTYSDITGTCSGNHNICTPATDQAVCVVSSPDNCQCPLSGNGLNCTWGATGGGATPTPAGGCWTGLCYCSCTNFCPVADGSGCSAQCAAACGSGNQVRNCTAPAPSCGGSNWSGSNSQSCCNERETCASRCGQVKDC